MSARLELIAFEAKEAKKHAAGRAALLVIILGSAGIAYLTILAGVIGWIASAGVPWYFVTLGAAFLHLLVAGIAVAIIKRPLPPAFTHTKAELAKDREWLINKKNPGSRP
ncbi:phage holin family protein [Haloferula sp. BvORR071]|uniref:phage holin family protein n=1 Tax=Haloferula sp. BvORR071 TaxID=1396141 RepID=UPI000551511B|nr:phage holin family protein [Haloferula sp. BvORR071]